MQKPGLLPCWAIQLSLEYQRSQGQGSVLDRGSYSLLIRVPLGQVLWERAWVVPVATKGHCPRRRGPSGGGGNIQALWWPFSWEEVGGVELAEPQSLQAESRVSSASRAGVGRSPLPSVRQRGFPFYFARVFKKSSPNCKVSPPCSFCSQPALGPCKAQPAPRPSPTPAPHFL